MKKNHATNTHCVQTQKVFTRYSAVERVSPDTILTLYHIFIRYYDNVSLDSFMRDMSRKTGVFIVRRRSDRQVVGFSTISRVDFIANNRPIKGVFSGDTIIEPEYWGSRSLQLSFYLFLFRTVLRYPLTPVFWILISKGYKTYLLLANNFFRFYPHPDNEFSEYANVVTAYCEQVFPEYYDAERGLLDFGEGYNCLKPNVAGISDEQRQRWPRIAFFEQKNPTWQKGTELPCVGRAGFSDVLRFAFRIIHKSLRGGSRVQAGLQKVPTQQKPARTMP